MRYKAGTPLRSRRSNTNPPTPSTPVPVVMVQTPAVQTTLVTALAEFLSRLTTSVYIVSPFSPVRRVWEIIGVLLIVVNLFSYVSDNLLEKTFGWLPVTDIYFFLDMLMRFKTGYICSATGEVVMDPSRIAQRYLRGWFLLDLVLSIPYHFLYRCFLNTASLQLFGVIRSEKNKARPIWNFIRNRQYRRDMLKRFREFLAEKQFVQKLLMMQPGKPSLFRRTLRLVGGLFRLTRRLRLMSAYADAVSRLNSLAGSVRTLSLLTRPNSRAPPQPLPQKNVVVL
jgi:hypothetical protein